MEMRVLVLLLLTTASVNAIKVAPDCDLVRCARPLCEEGVPTVTPLGQCCPVCSPTTVEPETKQPEETEQPTVNTEATTVSEPATGKPCDIDGAVPVRCASPCPATCTRPFVICEVIVCDIPRLCECPSGQVVDEVHNRCVPRDDCPPAASVPPGTVEPVTEPEPETKLPDTPPTPEEEEFEEYYDDETKPVPQPNPKPEFGDYDYDPYNSEESEDSSSPKPHEPEPDPDDGSTDPLECPPDRPLSLCKMNPCDVNTCPAYPDARCKADFCGGCNARFFVGDKEVTDSCGNSDVGSGSGVTKPKLLCSVEGATYSECGAACPPTCLTPAILCLIQGCFPGCTCPDGQLIDEVNNRCVPLEQCPPLDPCASVACAPGYLCEVYKPTGEAVCEPYCDLDNGGCPPDQLCQLRQPQCIRNPCPPHVECVEAPNTGTDEPGIVPKPKEATEAAKPTESEPEATEPEAPNEPKFPGKPKETYGTKPPASTTTEPEAPNEPGKSKPTDATDESYGTKPPKSTTAQATLTPSSNASCPPTCSMAFCSQKANKRALCTAPGPREIPGCTGSCQLTYCHACYNSETSVDIPGSCEACEDYTAESSCFKAWAKCVRRAQITEHGKLAKRLRTESNFRCHRPPCGLRG